jgi:hypothetical protein
MRVQRESVSDHIIVEICDKGTPQNPQGSGRR